MIDRERKKISKEEEEERRHIRKRTAGETDYCATDHAKEIKIAKETEREREREIERYRDRERERMKAMAK